MQRGQQQRDKSSQMEGGRASCVFDEVCVSAPCLAKLPKRREITAGVRSPLLSHENPLVTYFTLAGFSAAGRTPTEPYFYCVVVLVHDKEIGPDTQKYLSFVFAVV